MDPEGYLMSLGNFAIGKIGAPFAATGLSLSKLTPSMQSRMVFGLLRICG